MDTFRDYSTIDNNLKAQQTQKHKQQLREVILHRLSVKKSEEEGEGEREEARAMKKKKLSTDGCCWSGDGQEKRLSEVAHPRFLPALPTLESLHFQMKPSCQFSQEEEGFLQWQQQTQVLDTSKIVVIESDDSGVEHKEANTIQTKELFGIEEPKDFDDDETISSPLSSSLMKEDTDRVLQPSSKCGQRINSLIVVGEPPAHLRWCTELVQKFPPHLKRPEEHCAVCGREPPVNASAFHSGPIDLRSRKIPMPPNFIQVGGGNGYGKSARNYNIKNAGEKQQQGQTIICCQECFDFFRQIVVQHRDAVAPSSPSLNLRCVEGNGNCAVNSFENRCSSCWLDRCLLAGMTAQAVASEQHCFNYWVSKKARVRMAQLDVSFRWRLERLILQMQPAANVLVDENVLEFGLLKSMAYIDEQFSSLRQACSSPGKIRRVFKMFKDFSIVDMVDAHPSLLGSTHNQRLLNNCDNSDSSCAIPNTPGCEHFANYVTVPLAHNDHFFTNMYFSYLDIFLSFEIAHTMPVFRLLDKNDIVVQLAYTSFFCRALAQISYSAALGAPEIVQPNGNYTHRTMVSVIRKAQKAMTDQKEDREQYFPFSFAEDDENSPLIPGKDEGNCCESLQGVEAVDMVPIRVMAAPDLLKKYEETSRLMRIELLKPFLRAKLSTTEVFMLRAIIITSPCPRGLSENARLLLETERDKHVKLLRNHLRKELQTEQAVDHRYAQLMALLELVAEHRRLTAMTGALSSVLFKIPVHRHRGEAEAEDQRSQPTFMSECRAAYSIA